MSESFETGKRVKAIITIRRWRISEGTEGVIKAARSREHELDVEFPDIGLVEGVEDYHFRLAEESENGGKGSDE